ncbi:gamma-aminobutyric acid receptor alpha-like [Liolophura sinensis]|uniref:gamma-aminobutyric acid receptor alpha-like n=1 Tax=Liolophura sinensis TaxID=3198878 RepID=UPI0031590018
MEVFDNRKVIHVVFFMWSYLLTTCIGWTKNDNMTFILNKLLEGYDKRLRPGFGGMPVVVHADINLRSMGPISERDMIYTLDCYFRQSWVDERLAFNISIQNVSLSIKMLEKIWAPDTVFYNGRHAILHTITTPNKFFRIGMDGSILYSQRLTVKASCPMHLEKFPMDTQQCPLVIGSFGYSTDDVTYKWSYGYEKAVELASTMTMSQFDLVGFPAFNGTSESKAGARSLLTVKFQLRRRAGYFLIQVYVPCSLLVILSWVSFWINREATADRITLGVTTVLTMTFLGLDNRTDLPKVSYSTALDLYLAVCYLFVLAAILQFAAVHYFTKRGSGEIYPWMHVSDSDEDTSEFDTSEEGITPAEPNCRTPLKSMNGATYPPRSRPNNCHSRPVGQDHFDRRDSKYKKIWGSIMGSLRRKTRVKRRKREVTLNSVSKIDRGSRYLFPLGFIIFNIIYWKTFWR